MFRSCLPVLFFVLSSAIPAFAVDFHWDGGGSDDNFTTQENWFFDIEPFNDGNDEIIFEYGNYTPFVDEIWNCAGISFSDAGWSFDVSGELLRIGALGIESNNPWVSAVHSIANDIELTVNQTWEATENPVTLTGAIALSNKVLTIAGGAGIELAGPVNLGFIDVVAGGVLTLSGDVSCDVDNQGGTLIVATDQPQFPGSVMQFTGSSALGATGVHVTGVSLDTGGELTFIGPGTMAAMNGIRGSGSLVLDAPAFGAGLALGGGYLTPFTGAVDIRAGRLDMLAAQPGVPALTGPITVGDGIGPADEAVLELEAPGIVQTEFGWIPVIAADGALVLGGDHVVTEFVLAGGRFSCNGVFQTENVDVDPSDRTARIEGTWETPSAGGLDVVTVADGAAEPDLLFSGVKQGPGGLLVRGPGHTEMSGPANALAGRLLVENAALTLNRDTTLEPMNLGAFHATDSDIVATADDQLGPDCDVSLTRSTFDPGEGLRHSLHELSLDDAVVENQLGELRVHGPVDVLSTSTLDCTLRFMQNPGTLTVALGDSLLGRQFTGQTIDLTGQGYIIADYMSGQVNVWDPTLISAGSFHDLFVQSHLNVPVDMDDGVLNVSSSLTLHADSDVTLTLRDTAEYSRIEVSAGLVGTGVANLGGYLEVALASDVDVSVGDEFVLVRAGVINGAFDSVVVEYVPEPGQSWTVYSASDNGYQELRLRLDGLSPVGDTPPDMVTVLDLRAAPNPFNPRTTVAFDLPQSGSARIDVVDLRGRVVTRLVDGDMPAGRHEAVFTGRDGNGHALPSGVYFVRLQSAAGNMIRKVTLLQ